MTDGLESTTADDARQLTRRRREQRTDHVLEVPFVTNNVDVECPACGHEWTVTIMIPLDEPSFGPCSNWDCDAYLKMVHDGSESEAVQASNPDRERDQQQEEQPANQTDLEQFSQPSA